MRTATLSEISERIDYGLTASASPNPVGPRFLRITDIVDDTFDLQSVPYVDTSEETARKYTLVPGDIVIARTGATTGASLWFNHDEEPVTFASYLVRFRIRDDHNSRFIGYVLKSDAWKNYVNAEAHSKSAQPNMSAALMAEFRFALPPRREQQAIAEVLGALDDKIAANSRVIETSMQLGETLARRYATAPKPLEDIATITMGTSPKGEFLNEQGEGLPFYQGVRDFGVISPTERVFTESPVRTTPAGSILFAVRAPVGEVNLAPSETAIGRGVAGFHSEAQTATMFFGLRVFASIWDQFDGGGTVFSSVTAAEVRTAMLPMPSDEEASRVEQTLSALLTRATAANQENIVLARTRDELLPLLMSGRMKVGDVQARVEEVM